MRQGAAISTAACGYSASSQSAARGLPSRRPSDRPARSAARSAWVAAISRFMSAWSISLVAVRSSTWSPIATPMRSGSSVPAGRKRPSGRFWIGKSQPVSLAESTQLRSAGSWVSSRVFMA